MRQTCHRLGLDSASRNTRGQDSTDGPECPLTSHGLSVLFSGSLLYHHMLILPQKLTLYKPAIAKTISINFVPCPAARALKSTLPIKNGHWSTWSTAL